MELTKIQKLLCKIKCLLGKHEWVKFKEGMFFYRKGKREKLYFFGSMYRCNQCDKQTFKSDRIELRKDSKQRIMKVPVNKILYRRYKED